MIYILQIPYGHKYEKDYVLKSLLGYVTPEVFIPIMVNNYILSFITNILSSMLIR
jgi:hypothetical protein